VLNDVLITSLAIGVIVLLLPWRPWSTRESIEANPATAADLSNVTVLIPARNEAGTIGETLQALAAQGPGLTIFLIDDQSDDGTTEAARNGDIPGLTVIAGTELPAGWSGKLWALEQGRRHVGTPLTLLLDADIVLAPGMIAALRDQLLGRQLQLVSVMAHLGMRDFWERLLLPAFVYFFKMIYPFALSNARGGRIAAAAGGCILLETAVLDKIGGFAALKDALIDDCTLAARIKAAGGGTWIGLTHSAISRRRYASLSDVWEMVARTAFTQLRYSTLLLLACTALMIVTYVAPVAGTWVAPGPQRWLAAAAWVIVVVPYVPTLRYYRIPAAWAVLLPLVAALYLAMTWGSALRYWQGERSRWKGRAYQRAGAIEP
jgi:hopene-associated glycosyltransferase HpnB